MFHDDKLKRQIEEAYTKMVEPDKDKDKDGTEDSLEPTHSEEGGGAGGGGAGGAGGGGGGGGDGGDGGAVAGTTTATTATTGSDSSDSDSSDTDSPNNDQRGLGGYYGMPMGRRSCVNGWNKDGSCKKNESVDNEVDSTQELYAIYEGMRKIEADEAQHINELDIPDKVTANEWAVARQKYGFDVPRDDLVNIIIQNRKQPTPNTPAGVYEAAGTSARYAASDKIVAMSNDAENSENHSEPVTKPTGVDEGSKSKIRNDRRRNKQKGYDLDENSKDKRKNNPCWKNHKKVGMKTKNGKKVPNCVPAESELREARKKFKRLARIINESHLNDEIRGVWQAFDQLAERIARLEKS